MRNPYEAEPAEEPRVCATCARYFDFDRMCNVPEAVEKLLRERFGIVLAIISICIAPVVSLAPSGLYDFLQSCFGFFNVPILATVIIGMFTKYPPPIAPKAGLVLHVVLYSLTKTPLFPIHCHYLYVLFFLFVFRTF